MVIKNINDKVEASIMLASYLETIGFKNGAWEFNYRITTKEFAINSRIWLNLLHHFAILGGANYINVSGWNSSDDTILIIATANACIKDGGEDNYKNEYVENYDLLLDEKRASGLNTIETLKLLKKNYSIETLPSNTNMGGNGSAMRTGPIGLTWYDDIEKVIEESIIASRLTHNYYLGYLGGMVTALFTAFAVNDIKPWKWCSELIKLHNNKTIHKYYPKEHDVSHLDEYIGYWKRYEETRINKIKYKNSLDTFIYPEDRLEYLFGYFPNPKIKSMVLRGESLKKMSFDWGHIGSTGLDACIYAYDCLLMSIQTPGSKNIDFDNVIYSWDTFVTLVAIHPGDNDTTASIGGTWFGALVGYNGIDKDRMKELEFYKELKNVSDKIIKKLK